MGVSRIVEWQTTLILLIVLTVAVIEVIIALMIHREINKVNLTDYEKQLLDWKYPIEDSFLAYDEIDIKEVKQHTENNYNRRRSDRNKT